MAERRMFAKTIIGSDAFLDMPQSSQALYFHLAMRADDEGFVNNPKSIMRLVGGKDDDIKLLIAKKFIIPFESGVVVIKHWRMHNYIRGDRVHKTKYQKEKALLELDENEAYRIADKCQSSDRQLGDKCHTEDRLGKDRLGKVSKDMSEIALQFQEFWSLYPKKIGKGAAEKAWIKIKPSAELYQVIIDAVMRAKKSKEWLKESGQYIPNPATWLNQSRWEDELTEAEHANESNPYNFKPSTGFKSANDV